MDWLPTPVFENPEDWGEDFEDDCWEYDPSNSGYDQYVDLEDMGNESDETVTNPPYRSSYHSPYHSTGPDENDTWEHSQKKEEKEGYKDYKDYKDYKNLGLSIRSSLQKMFPIPIPILTHHFPKHVWDSVHLFLHQFMEEVTEFMDFVRLS